MANVIDFPKPQEFVVDVVDGVGPFVIHLDDCDVYSRALGAMLVENMNSRLVVEIEWQGKFVILYLKINNTIHVFNGVAFEIGDRPLVVDCQYEASHEVNTPGG